MDISLRNRCQSAAASARESVGRLRRRAANGQYFVSFDELRTKLTRKLILEVISHDEIAEHRRPQVATKIVERGLRIFAILLLLNQELLINHFIDCDELDMKLPMNEDQVKRISPSVSTQFCTEKQWELIPFAFSREECHRKLRDEIILPYIQEVRIGEGSGGDIFKCIIPYNQQSIYENNSDTTVTVVRKRIKMRSSREGTTKAYRKELDCLELLRLLRHECIVELLGSYEHRHEHYLIFPFFPMDLASFFKEKTAFGHFVNRICFYDALCGLSSAVQSIHDMSISSKDLLLSRIGYHHDLRPKNILVSPNKFILADFGLAGFKPAHEESHTYWKNTIGDYIAPECMSEDYTHLNVGRSIDIWAFGCLITELTAYMERGALGVERFREVRRRTESQLRIANTYFFEGDELRKSIDGWLSDLSCQPKDRGVRALIECARLLLQVDIDRRPKAASLSSRLLYIKCTMIYREIKKHLNENLDVLYSTTNNPGGSPHDHLSALFQCEMLAAWGRVLGMEDDQCSHDCLESRVDLLAVERNLQNLLHVAQGGWFQRSSLGIAKLPLVEKTSRERIEVSIQKLWKLSPLHYQHRMEHVWRQASLRSEDLTFLKEVEQTISLSPRQTDLASCAALKRLAIEFERQDALDTTKGKNLLLNSMQVERQGQLNTHCEIGTIELSSQPHPESERTRIVIEWFRYSPTWAGQSDEEKVMKSLGLAEILSVRKPDSFRTLNCLGILPPHHTLSSNGFAIIYAYPHYHTENPVTLNTQLWSKDIEVLLEDKFRIARCLVSSLAELHSADWLHKNFQSSNVLFFPSKRNFSSLSAAGEPFLVGFQHSRPNGEIWYSDMDESETNAELYRDPRYSPGRGTRFQKEFDYYSLGVVLLEIGFWQPITSFRVQHHRQQLDRTQFRDLLRDKYAPKLGPKMGSRYRDIVVACLNGLYVDHAVDSEQDYQDKFFWKVIDPLYDMKLE